MPFTYLIGGAVIVVIILLALLFKIIKSPIKWALKLLFHAAMGFIALFLLNWACKTFGINSGVNLIDPNLINCLVAGVLGVPGVILLVLIKYIF